VSAPARAGYEHDALFVRSDEELVDFAVPFLRAGLEAHEASLVVCSPQTNALLVDALDRGHGIIFVPGAEVFRRTTRALLAYEQMVERELDRGASRVRIIGEVGFGDHPRGRAESMRFEAVANVALTRHPLWNVCVYDTRRLPRDALAFGEATHPVLIDGNERRPNEAYRDPAEMLRRAPSEGPDPIEDSPPALQVADFDRFGLATLRSAIRQVAVTRSALPLSRLEDFVEAVSELAGNAVKHGSGRVRVRLWVSVSRVVCTVTDQGEGFDDPLAGYVQPRPGHAHGMGLWLVRNLTDSLSFGRTPEGFTARVMIADDG
jgi:anti-sigma regulatory factor (Ser/Thr protein kinase)